MPRRFRNVVAGVFENMPCLILLLVVSLHTLPGARRRGLGREEKNNKTRTQLNSPRVCTTVGVRCLNLVLAPGYE